MELGGKCPSIVCEDANLELAAKTCAFAALLNHGQICFSTERIIVHKNIAEKFKAMLAQIVPVLTPMIGHAVSENTAKAAFNMLKEAKDAGVEFLVGGPEMTSNASILPSIVLEPKNVRIRSEETFGPSASLYVVDSDEEAVALANDSPYGLNAAVFSSNMERALNISKELEYGKVHLNAPTIYATHNAPQGGVKGSGWGRANGVKGIEEFLVTKTVSWHGQTGPPMPA